MPVVYDKDIFNKYYQQAITKREELSVGNTYYSNALPGPIVLVELISNNEMWRRNDYAEYTGTDGESLDWAVFRLEDGSLHTGMLAELNITQNTPNSPYMVFTNENTANECRRELIPEYEYPKFPA